MKVYELGTDADHYQGLIIPSGDLFAFSHRFAGKPFEHSWTDMQIEFDPDTYSFPKGDFPSLISNVPIFSPRAAMALRDMLAGNGELLPITCGRDDYYLFNTTRVIDALDEVNSVVSRFSTDGRIFYIDHHVFRLEKLQGLTIFKIPQVIRIDVFVTDTFVERVHSTGLKGFWFRLVWSSE